MSLYTATALGVLALALIAAYFVAKSLTVEN